MNSGLSNTKQDPHQADSILRIQKELDETKIVLHKTIESVLQRGEKIDDLVQKSDGLSAQSKMFYRTSTWQLYNFVVMLTRRLQNKRRRRTPAGKLSGQPSVLSSPLCPPSPLFQVYWRDSWLTSVRSVVM